MQNIEPEVAISYSQDSQVYIEKVISFANFLRDNGYDCYMDMLLKQIDTSIDFNEMMLQLIPKAKKVIVILTPNYKEKADNFKGGVGKEYRIINDEILRNDNKYLLVTFLSLSTTHVSTLLPHGLEGREIIDLNEDSKNGYELLFSKLSDTPIYTFSPVNSNKTKTTTKLIKPFALNQTKDKNEIFSCIKNYLTENKQLLMQYGPNSLIALNNPLSTSADVWTSIKRNTIIPNNQQIISILEDNLDILSQDESNIYYKFKIHANAFERNQIERQDSEAVPCFPLEFEKMIYKEAD
ncbi:toll/interleukin-1 receptor domain-containing protein [Anaerosporobacter sp.]|uniref:toll/interleukin-1 receptor domain-containing protein n=1 Tax=Anaerosporobacter sp. TaxID=1872529 RepID=UPI00286F8857|nr:toll/interleukin-1 receptor domain-containing protein [Anaerosporobacter sp.]